MAKKQKAKAKASMMKMKASAKLAAARKVRSPSPEAAAQSRLDESSDDELQLAHTDEDEDEDEGSAAPVGLVRQQQRQRQKMINRNMTPEEAAIVIQKARRRRSQRLADALSDFVIDHQTTELWAERSARIPLFAELNSEELVQLGKSMKSCKVQAHRDVLIEKGGSSNRLYFLDADCTATMYIDRYVGSESRAFATVSGEGAFFGGLVTNSEKRSVTHMTVRLDVDAVLLYLPGECYFGIFKQYPVLRQTITDTQQQWRNECALQFLQQNNCDVFEQLSASQRTGLVETMSLQQIYATDKDAPLLKMGHLLTMKERQIQAVTEEPKKGGKKGTGKKKRQRRASVPTLLSLTDLSENVFLVAAGTAGAYILPEGAAFSSSDRQKVATLRVGDFIGETSLAPSYLDVTVDSEIIVWAIPRDAVENISATAPTIHELIQAEMDGTESAQSKEFSADVAVQFGNTKQWDAVHLTLDQEGLLKVLDELTRIPLRTATVPLRTAAVPLRTGTASVASRNGPSCEPHRLPVANLNGIRYGW